MTQSLSGGGGGGGGGEASLSRGEASLTRGERLGYTYRTEERDSQTGSGYLRISVYRQFLSDCRMEKEHFSTVILLGYA